MSLANSKANSIIARNYQASLTPEIRSSRARQAALSRWKNIPYKDRRIHALKMVAARQRIIL